jgi:hypothetical protein
MATTEQLLSSILSELKGIRAELAKGSGKAEARSSSQSSGGGDVASERDMDGEYGNPTIKKDPPRWNVDVNGSFAGCSYSECPPEYLDVVATFKDWLADKDEASGAKDAKGRPKSQWSRKDARLARGWAKRKRDGWNDGGGNRSAPAPEAPSGNAPDVIDDLPF